MRLSGRLSQWLRLSLEEWFNSPLGDFEDFHFSLDFPLFPGFLPILRAYRAFSFAGLGSSGFFGPIFISPCQAEQRDPNTRAMSPIPKQLR